MCSGYLHFFKIIFHRRRRRRRRRRSLLATHYCVSVKIYSCPETQDGQIHYRQDQPTKSCKLICFLRGGIKQRRNSFYPGRVECLARVYLSRNMYARAYKHSNRFGEGFLGIFAHRVQKPWISLFDIPFQERKFQPREAQERERRVLSNKNKKMTIRSRSNETWIRSNSYQPDHICTVFQRFLRGRTFLQIVNFSGPECSYYNGGDQSFEKVTPAS